MIPNELRQFEISKLKCYEVDDQVVAWWVLAEDENDALALVIDIEERAGMNIVEDDWNDTGWPEVSQMKFKDLDNFFVWRDDLNETISMLVDVAQNFTRRVISCSEF